LASTSLETILCNFYLYGMLVIYVLKLLCLSFACVMFFFPGHLVSLKTMMRTKKLSTSSIRNIQ